MYTKISHCCREISGWRSIRTKVMERTISGKPFSYNSRTWRAQSLDRSLHKKRSIALKDLGWNLKRNELKQKSARRKGKLNWPTEFFRQDDPRLVDVSCISAQFINVLFTCVIHRGCTLAIQDSDSENPFRGIKNPEGYVSATHVPTNERWQNLSSSS